jgi:hypothetical protein
LTLVATSIIIGFAASAIRKRVRYYIDMREIKFRVWSFNEKVFHYFYVYEGFSGYYGSWSHPQEFTGLKDRNSREIYEGDIISFGRLNYEVSWMDGRFIASCPNYSKYHWPRFEFPSSEVRCSEIVGNTFENPELLK